MARVRRRSIQMAKAGFGLSIFAAVAALGTFILMAKYWHFGDMTIAMGKIRQLAIMLALACTVLSGFAALLMGLEGAAECQGRTKTAGWVGFALGAIACMIGIILSLCFLFYKI